MAPLCVYLLLSAPHPRGALMRGCDTVQPRAYLCSGMLCRISKAVVMAHCDLKVWFECGEVWWCRVGSCCTCDACAV